MGTRATAGQTVINSATGKTSKGGAFTQHAHAVTTTPPPPMPVALEPITDGVYKVKSKDVIETRKVGTSWRGTVEVTLESGHKFASYAGPYQTRKALIEDAAQAGNPGGPTAIIRDGKIDGWQYDFR